MSANANALEEPLKSRLATTVYSGLLPQLSTRGSGVSPAMYCNPKAASWTYHGHSPGNDVLDFHKTLPYYDSTPTVKLESLASTLGVRSLYFKDESQRFGLPSFKILGASWAIYQAVCKELALEPSVTLNELSAAAEEKGVSLVSCSDGNWGRAVARMASYLKIAATIYVPENIDKATQDKISGEGACCLVSPGDYNASIRAAQKLASETKGALMVMDTSWTGYTEIPQWVTDGYSTMLKEVDAEVPDPSLVIVSVGVGSWAHLIVAHYKRPARTTKIATVEPTGAASLLASLRNGEVTPIKTGDTIMCGMNCGTTSDIAWQLLREGVDISLTVTDLEAHNAVQELREHGGGRVDPGPCGAAPMAALRKILQDPATATEAQRGDIVLFCTEGARAYDIPSV